MKFDQRPAANNPLSQSTRLDYLDSVRAFALLLGIVFHAALSFVPTFIGWAVMDVSTSSIVTSFILVSHSFRMELFFLIAGFFSHMTFHKKGARTFLRSRFTRIAIPFLVGWFILRPLIVSGWIMGYQSMSGEAKILEGLIGGCLSLGELPKDLLVGTHLWFLYCLLIVTSAALLIRQVLTINPKLHTASARIGDATAKWLSTSRFAIIALSLPTTAGLLFMSDWGMDTPDKSLIPHLPTFILYGGFFTFGWLLHRQQNLISQFARLSIARFALCIVSILACLILSEFQQDLGHPEYQTIRTAFSFSYALMMWALVALTIGLFKRFLDHPSKYVRYIADSSYWLYLVHLPIVVWLQIAVAEIELHWAIKLPSISLLTVLISLLIYDLCIRPTFIGALLNGRRKPSQLLPKHTLNTH
ncbi:MAG: acyltransferase family protein [Verrucomicrobiota bacterium]